jgi:hypothetical protein
MLQKLVGEVGADETGSSQDEEAFAHPNLSRA